MSDQYKYTASLVNTSCVVDKRDGKSFTLNFDYFSDKKGLIPSCIDFSSFDASVDAEALLGAQFNWSFRTIASASLDFLRKADRKNATFELALCHHPGFTHLTKKSNLVRLCEYWEYLENCAAPIAPLSCCGLHLKSEVLSGYSAISYTNYFPESLLGSRSVIDPNTCMESFTLKPQAVPSAVRYVQRNTIVAITNDTAIRIRTIISRAEDEQFSEDFVCSVLGANRAIVLSLKSSNAIENVEIENEETNEEMPSVFNWPRSSVRDFDEVERDLNPSERQVSYCMRFYDTDDVDEVDFVDSPVKDNPEYSTLDEFLECSPLHLPPIKDSSDTIAQEVFSDIHKRADDFSFTLGRLKIAEQVFIEDLINMSYLGK